MFENFSDETISAIKLAGDESRKSKRNYIGTEQLLMGLALEENATSSNVLSSLGLNPEKIRKEIENMIGNGKDEIEEVIPFTARAKRTFELALKEAQKYNSTAVKSEHLLLALICEGTGVASEVLERLGINLADIRPTTVKLMESHEKRAEPHE